MIPQESTKNKNSEQVRRFSAEFLTKNSTTDDLVSFQQKNKFKSKYIRYSDSYIFPESNFSNKGKSIFGLRIIITNVMSPKEIWYRNSDFDRELNHMEKELALSYNSCDIDTVELLVGEKYMVKLNDWNAKGEEHVCRCKLINFESGEDTGFVMVLTIDHGTYHKVPENTVKSLLDSEYYDMNAFAERGCLPNLKIYGESKKWSPVQRSNILQFLRSSCVKEIYVKLIVSNSYTNFTFTVWNICTLFQILTTTFQNSDIYKKQQQVMSNT